MFQPNVSRKITAPAHVGVCILLLVLAVIFSFTPLITLETESSEIMQSVDTLMDSLSTGESIEEKDIPDEVSISAVDLIGSISLIKNIYDVNTEDSKDMDQDKSKQIEELLESEEGKQTIITVLAIVNTLTNSFDDDDTQDAEGFLNIIVKLLTVLVSILYVLGYTLICPIILIITTIVALIQLLIGRKDLCAVEPKIASKLPGILSTLMIFFIFQTLIPGMGYGSGLMALWIITAISVFANFVVSRLRTYDTKHFIYINIIQGAALVGAIGYIVFFFNFLKANIFGQFIDSKWLIYAAKAGVAKESGATVDGAYIADGIMVLVTLVVALSTVSYFVACAQRLSFSTDKKGKPAAKDSQIVKAVILLIATILPMIVKGSKNLYADVTDTASEARSTLALTASEESALTTALVGAIILLVAEIAILVLKKVFCGDMTDSDMEAIKSSAEAEAVAAAPAQAPEAEQANDAVAASATVEETPAAEEPAAVEETTTEQE